MNIVLNPLSFNPENLFFMDKKKNNIIDGFFSKIIYSSELCTMNGIIYLLPLTFKPQDACISNIHTLYQESKHTVYFYTQDSKNMQYIILLSNIEKTIIDTYKEMNDLAKRNVLSLTTQLYKGYFKIFKEKQNNQLSKPKQYMLKISGIWENAEEIGITYKFVEVYNDRLL